MFHLLENKRFKELKGSAIKLQGDLLYNRRCPKCTLIPPCKHYESPDDILADARNFITSDNFKSHLSPKKRQSLMRAVKDPTFNQTQMTHMSPNIDMNETSNMLVNDPSM